MNGLFKPKGRIPGSDIAGEVTALGAGVTSLAPGDRVHGDLCMAGFGGFAEFVCAPARCLVRMPDAMSFEQAAAIPQAGMLAVQGSKRDACCPCLTESTSWRKRHKPCIDSCAPSTWARS